MNGMDDNKTCKLLFMPCFNQIIDKYDKLFARQWKTIIFKHWPHCFLLALDSLIWCSDFNQFNKIVVEPAGKFLHKHYRLLHIQASLNSSHIRSLLVNFRCSSHFPRLHTHEKLLEVKRWAGSCVQMNRFCFIANAGDAQTKAKVFVQFIHI